MCVGACVFVRVWVSVLKCGCVLPSSFYHVLQLLLLLCLNWKIFTISTLLFIHLYSALFRFVFFFFVVFALFLHKTKFIIVSNEMSVRQHRSTWKRCGCNCVKEKQLRRDI